jgi:hypothetical protein
MPIYKAFYNIDYVIGEEQIGEAGDQVVDTQL